MRGSNGTLQYTRILLDSGSQVSVITFDCVARLGLDFRKCHTKIVGSSIVVQYTNSRVKVQLIRFGVQLLVHLYHFMR